MRKFSLPKLTILIITACILLVFICSCSSPDRIKYYSQKENFISVTGTVASIRYGEDGSALYIDFSELSPVLDDTCFKIVGKNLKTVQVNNIDDKLKTGEQITFMTAPRYFGDGYVMPIVAISLSGEDLLGFEEGYKNLLDWLSN